MDKSKLAKNNKNIKFLFTIIDIYTQCAWANPLEDESGKRTTTAFKKPMETSKGKPEKMWSEKSEEFN